MQVQGDLECSIFLSDFGLDIYNYKKIKYILTEGNLKEMDTIPRFDTLGIYDKSLFIRQTLQEKEELFYSCNVQKYNRYGFL